MVRIVQNKKTNIKKSSWKIFQSSKRKKGKINLALFVLVLLLFILILGFGLKLVQGLAAPFSLMNTQKNYSWDGDLNLNLVYKSNDISLIQLDPEEKTLKIVKLPPQAYLEIPGGYGFWQLRAVYDLGQAEKPPKGTKLLKSTISDFFALPIDGLIEIKSNRAYTAKEFIEILKQSPFMVVKFLPELKTDLTVIEFWRFSSAVRNIRFDKIAEFDLLTRELLEKRLDLDGTLQLVGDESIIDGFVTKNLSDEQLGNESIDVAIFNTTEIPGLGQTVGRLVSHLGANVTQVGSIEDFNVEQSVVVNNKKENTKTLKRLTNLFKICENPAVCDIINHPTISSSRGEIVIILGKDFKQ